MLPSSVFCSLEFDKGSCGIYISSLSHLYKSIILHRKLQNGRVGKSVGLFTEILFPHVGHIYSIFARIIDFHSPFRVPFLSLPYCFSRMLVVASALVEGLCDLPDVFCLTGLALIR